MKNANYRKHNDHTHNSSSYHKKDGTNIRAILRREAEKEAASAMKEIEMTDKETVKIVTLSEQSIVGRFTRSGWPMKYVNEVHQQQYGNRNYVIVHKRYDETTGRLVSSKIQEGGSVYTAFTKDTACGPDDYTEGIDIELGRGTKGSRAYVRQIAEAVLKAEYQPGLRVCSIAEQPSLS